MMPRLSANLGFLWADLALPDAIRAAARAGVRRGRMPLALCRRSGAGPRGAGRDRAGNAGPEHAARCAGRKRPFRPLSGREAEARRHRPGLFDYAARIGCKAVHVMAGFAQGAAADAAFEANLNFACDMAAAQGATVLIEPLNRL